jgi:phosphate transport system ATP-binding protein
MSEPAGQVSEPARQADQPASPVSEPLIPPEEPASRVDGSADLRDGQPPPTAEFPPAAPWLEPGGGLAPDGGPDPKPDREPAPQGDLGPRTVQPAGESAPAIVVDEHQDGQRRVGFYRGDQHADGRQPQPGPLVGLEARNVAAWFGDHKVLEGVSLKMEPGKVTALIGPSGCGKSTFLRILNRMHELVRTAALAGEVLLGGEDIYDPKRRPAEIRRRIGMVFQKPNPFPAMSIYDNVASGLKLAGIKVHNRDAVVEISLRRAGLWNEVYRRLRSPGGALSGGQQQRLCIARSLAVSPAVLLMDEPCSALDPTSTRRIEETIRELADQVTVVIVTHNMQQAQRVSENCAFFLASENTPGYIVESGPTEQVFEDPADPRTADYVHGRFG